MVNRRKKVLLVTNMWPSRERPYFGLFVQEQVEAFGKGGFNLEFEILVIDGYKSKLNYVFSVFSILKAIRSGRFDLIHIHFGLSGFFLLLIGKPKIPIICTFHGSDISSNSKRYLIKWISFKIAKKCDRLIVLNDDMASELNARNFGSVKIPCGVNIDFFKPYKSENAISNPLLIGFPSDPSRIEKNYFLFQRVIEMLLIKYGLKVERLLFMKMDRTQILKSLNKIDVLLMTSNYEGSPQIIKEAMACNCRIVSRDVGDVSILLDGLNNAQVVPYNAEIQEYCEAVMKVLRASSSKNDESSRSRLNTLELTDLAVCEKLAGIYVDVIAQYNG